MEKNPINLNDPLLEFKKETKLKGGKEVTVTGLVFDHPVMEQGEPQCFNAVLIENKDLWQKNSTTIPANSTIGMALFERPMDSYELEDKVNNICEDVESYLPKELQDFLK